VSEASRKIWGLYRTYDILRVQQLQRDSALAQVDNSRCQISGGRI